MSTPRFSCARCNIALVPSVTYDSAGIEYPIRTCEKCGFTVNVDDVENYVRKMEEPHYYYDEMRAMMQEHESFAEAYSS